MSEYVAYDFVPYGLTVGVYVDELVFDVTDTDGNTTPMRFPEWNARHSVKGGDE